MSGVFPHFHILFPCLKQIRYGTGKYFYNTDIREQKRPKPRKKAEIKKIIFNDFMKLFFPKTKNSRHNYRTRVAFLFSAGSSENFSAALALTRDAQDIRPVG
jgi:hypothetical protein